VRSALFEKLDKPSHDYYLMIINDSKGYPMGLSLSHILLVLVAVLVVFGTRRLPGIMTDLAKGLRAFKDGLKDGEDKPVLLPHKTPPEKDA
jgi:sec-independent protein translocase protein TatA